MKRYNIKITGQNNLLHVLMLLLLRVKLFEGHMQTFKPPSVSRARGIRRSSMKPFNTEQSPRLINSRKAGDYYTYRILTQQSSRHKDKHDIYSLSGSDDGRTYFDSHTYLIRIHPSRDVFHGVKWFVLTNIKEVTVFWLSPKITRRRVGECTVLCHPNEVKVLRI